MQMIDQKLPIISHHGVIVSLEALSFISFNRFLTPN